jgi:murein DD-endopeptidase MepM/ murein hydrolase activator NlpD
MANLKENQLYSPANESFSSSGIAGAAKSIMNSSLGSPKRVGISPAARSVSSNIQSMKTQGGPAAGMSTNLGPVTVPYGGSTRYESFHPGIDIAAQIGTPAKAYAGGRVSEVVTGKKQGDKGYGNYVIVTDEQGNRHRYSHLYQQYVKVGDTITPGSVLGSIGNSGSTYSESGGTGSHLDYRIQSAYNKYINPARYLGLAKG